jgi:hypothetical protein
MKKWLIILLVLFVGLNIFLFWLYKQTGSKKQNQAAQPPATQSPSTEYPYFPANTETFLDEGKTWQMKAFQPIFKEFKEASPEGYLLVNYSDSSNGVLKEGKIFLGRQASYSDKASGERTVIDSIKLKDLLKKGDQFGIYYLSLVPSDFSMGMPYCQAQGQEGQKTECLWAYYKQESDKNGENIFYPFFVYRILKK